MPDSSAPQARIRPGTARLITLGLFTGGLVFCVAAGLPLLAALAFGLLCICCHAAYAGLRAKEIALLLGEGLRRIANILAIFLLIGVMTGVWRLSGTIPCLVDAAVTRIDPSFFSLWCFLLCAALSSLIGTAFGTVSTLGVICMIMARTAGFDEVMAGGAILSGCYVGDRCSPMSSSAALVCAITHTGIYENIGRMMRSCAVPLALTCAAYAALAFFQPPHAIGTGAAAALRENFRSGFWVVLPALAVLLSGILRIDVKKAMAASIACAAGAALFVQGCPPCELLAAAVLGYEPQAPGLAMLRGGGIASMAEVIGIVGLSSSYTALIERTGLISGFEDMIAAAARRIGAFRTTALVSLLSIAISCNQTLGTMVTRRLCAKAQPDGPAMALGLEDSVIVLSAVVPWSIAFSMCSTTLGVGPEMIVFGFYLYFLPVWRCLLPAAKTGGPLLTQNSSIEEPSCR